MALGGMTVQELTDRLSWYELRGWELFEAEYGPLHLASRFERAIAQVGAPFLKDTKARQLAPWPKELERDATPEEVLRVLKGSKRVAKKPLKRKGKT